MAAQARTTEIVLFVIILLIGAALRLAAPGSAVPTLAELRHAEDARAMLAGEPALVFQPPTPRHEPLFAGAVAVAMLVIDDDLVAGRLTSGLFGVLLTVLVYVWVRVSTQSRWLALATMAGLAVSQYGVSTSREATRLVTFPVVYMLAALLMRRGIRVQEDVDDDFLPLRDRPRADVDGWLWFVLAGVALGLTFYTYPVAYVMWLVFPAFYVFLGLTQSGVLRRVWRGLALMLVVGAVVAAPIILAEAEALSRIAMNEVAAVLRSLRAASRSLLGVIGVWGNRLGLGEGAPGDPLLGPVLSVLYYFGVSIAVLSLFFPYRPTRRGYRTAEDAFRITSTNMFMLLTLAAGLAPALLGAVSPERLPVIGVQPALYYFPALAVLWMAEGARRYVGEGGITALTVAYALVLIVVLGLTIGATFGG